MLLVVPLNLGLKKKNVILISLTLHREVNDYDFDLVNEGGIKSSSSYSSYVYGKGWLFDYRAKY